MYLLRSPADWAFLQVPDSSVLSTSERLLTINQKTATIIAQRGTKKTNLCNILLTKVAIQMNSQVLCVTMIKKSLNTMYK